MTCAHVDFRCANVLACTDGSALYWACWFRYDWIYSSSQYSNPKMSLSAILFTQPRFANIVSLLHCNMIWDCNAMWWEKLALNRSQLWLLILSTWCHLAWNCKNNIPWGLSITSCTGNLYGILPISVVCSSLFSTKRVDFLGFRVIYERALATIKESDL